MPSPIPSHTDAPIPVPDTPYTVTLTGEHGGPGARVVIMRGGAVVARAWWSDLRGEICASDAGPGQIPGAAYLAIERALVSRQQ